jgi:hypothetical protein
VFLTLSGSFARSKNPERCSVTYAIDIAIGNNNLTMDVEVAGKLAVDAEVREIEFNIHKSRMDNEGLRLRFDCAQGISNSRPL